MVLKCTICSRNITLKLPGLEYSRCNKCVHATATCAKLTNKQLTALRNSDGLEWSCEECFRNMTKRSSFFLPEDSDHEEDRECVNITGFDPKKLLRDISREIRKVVNDELEELTSSINFMNSQISDLEDTVREQDNAIKMLINKNTDLINTNKNQDLRIAALEQRTSDFEQKLLSSTLEIVGVPETPNQNTIEVGKEIAAKLKVDSQRVVGANRVTSRYKEKLGHIMVELQTSGDRWVSSARSMDVLAGNILTNLPADKASSRIYVRVALTPLTKTLLYKAKQNLCGSFKYIWCKEGKIYAKKNDSQRASIIRSEQDIENLCKS